MKVKIKCGHIESLDRLNVLNYQKKLGKKCLETVRTNEILPNPTFKQYIY
jgi:hypothetical protein